MRRLAILLLAAAACTPVLVVPTAIHPTASATERSVGVALGGAYGFQEGDGGASLLAIMVHAVALTYFMGTGRWIEETCTAYKLGEEGRTANVRLKYRIIPGMVASVDIMTGRKTILQYLLKPINKARTEAMRER